MVVPLDGVSDRKGHNTMKKLFALLLALTMILALAACGGSGASTTTEAAPAAEADTAPAAEQSAAEPAAEPAADDSDAYVIGISQLLEHPALDLATQGFQDALVDLLGDKVSFDLQIAQGESSNCTMIANGFVAAGVDLIMANATSALQAAASATGDIPILGTSVTDYATALDIEDWTGATGRNISGTSDLAPLDGQAEMLAELFPVADYPTVGIIYCSAEANSVYQATVIRGYLEDMGYAVDEFTFADSNDIASVVQNACDACSVLYVPTDNTAASNASAIDNVALPAGVPIIAGEESICQGCGVATLSISYYDLGYRTGEMAYDILVNGADVSTMDIAFAPQFTKEFVASRAEALGVTIPEDYVAIEAAE